MTAQGLTRERIEEVANGIRRRVLMEAVAHNEGYLCQACSSAETLATLYLQIMHLGPPVGPKIPPPFQGVPGPGRPVGAGAMYNGAHSPENDRFILSATHYSLALYALLIEAGRLNEHGLDHYSQDGSSVEQIGAEHSPGIEVTTGSLGQGLSQAVGMAIGRRRRGDQGRVWVFMSDGEFQEGETWEAFSMAAHYHLDNLGVYVDANGHQVDGPIITVQRIEPMAERVRSFGWRAYDVDGHDPDALIAPTLEPTQNRPMIVIARTDVCHGIPSLAGRRNLHFIRFRPGEAEAALADLGALQAGASS